MSSITISHNLEAGENIKIVPASSYQEGLWILDQLQSESTVNTLSATVQVRKALTSETLQTSLDALIRRHELLRTIFRLEEGRLVQVIAEDGHISLAVHNLQDESQAQQPSLIQRLQREQAQAVFDIGQGPLLRCALIQLSAEQSLLLLTVHRLIADDWAVALLIRELATVYEASADGQPSPLAPVSIQYAEFAQAQEQEQTTEALAEHLAYWKQQVEDAPPILPLPTDHARPAATSWRGAVWQTVLPSQLVQQLQAVSEQHQASLHDLLLSAFATLLARYTNQQDLLLGSLVPARRSLESQELFGPCDNTLVLRSNLEGDPSFVELLGRSRALLKAGHEHEVLPFDTLLKTVRPSRSMSYTPLFQVLLRLPWTLPALPEKWTLQPLETGSDAAEVDLTLHLSELPEGLACRFIYSTDLFEAPTIERMCTHWLTLLEGVVADPTLPISRLPIVPAAEREILLDKWTATQRTYPVDKSFSELFEEQVQRTPAAVAVAYEEDQLSYLDLNRKANRLARQLRERGVGPDTLVSLLSERGIPVLVSILAIFKAGGGYLPLDPHHPPSRQRYFIEQSRTPLVICTRTLEAQLSEALSEIPEEKRPPYLLIEDLLAEGEDDPMQEENLPHNGTPDSLAYVIYTSGSTGLPKGAILQRKGMINHLFAKIDALQLTGDDIVIQTASQCFDISVWQLLAVLLVGGRVQICPDDITQDPGLLLQAVEQKRVTILETVPSWLRAMLDTAQNVGKAGASLTALRWMVPTGEALPVELSRRWLNHYPNIPLLNAYGPTECSDDVTHYVVAEPPAEGVSNMPIGTAIPNMRIYVLDRHLQPQPIGVSGEICVGGIGVGRGYLDNEQKTREAFVPDPFSGVEGTRLYKTGDLGRFLPDGNLEFQGRVDFQVKIRGYRIELGEIEAVLNQHPAVREAVVLAREDKPGDKRLVAYAELKIGRQVTVEELRNLARQELAPYMVPAAIVVMEQFPLTNNGKLDRKALPVPEWNRSEKEEGYVAPILPKQKQLVALWEEFLGISPIGIRDNFFDLGGDSLLAARLFDRIGQIFGKKLPLSVFFAGATIENVAQALREDEQPEAQEFQTPTPLVTVQAGSSLKTPFFYLHGEWTGGAFYTKDVAQALGQEQPFYLLDPYQLVGFDVPPSIEEIAAAHLKTIRIVQPEGPYMLGGYCNGAMIAYEIARQLHAQGQTTELLLLIDPDTPAEDRWFLKLINNAGNLFSVSEKKQMEFFLSFGHVYRYVRFSRYRDRKIAELVGIVDPDESDHEARGKKANASLGQKLKGLLPDMKNLRQSNSTLYDWPSSEYLPDLYAGPITFFWTQEEPWRPLGWKQTMEAKRWDIETYTLPGNHITSRTTYLPVLIEHMCACINQAQERINKLK
jgi:amino acid adenylation domain-containing protein